MSLIFQGGVQTNVVPPEMVVGFDCRLSVDTDHAEFENWINVRIFAVPVLNIQVKICSI